MAFHPYKVGVNEDPPKPPRPSMFGSTTAQIRSKRLKDVGLWEKFDAKRKELRKGLEKKTHEWMEADRDAEDFIWEEFKELESQRRMGKLVLAEKADPVKAVLEAEAEKVEDLNVEKHGDAMLWALTYADDPLVSADDAPSKLHKSLLEAYRGNKDIKKDAHAKLAGFSAKRMEADAARRLGDEAIKRGADVPLRAIEAVRKFGEANRG